MDRWWCLMLSVLGGAVAMTHAVELRPLVDAPIIAPAMLPGDDGGNINGPSLLEMPAGTPGALGRYHLYFGHHKGTYIRLAYADALVGPWQIATDGVVPLTQVPAYRQRNGHLASPDALWIDNQVYLYVHGQMDERVRRQLGQDPNDITTGGQRTVLVRAADGVDFGEPSPVVGSFYMRVFAHQNEYYAIAWGGQLLKAEAGLDQPFTFGPVVTDALFPRPRIGNASGNYGPEDNDRRIRHVAIDHEPDGTVRVYYTCTFDRPESIYRARLVTDGDWLTWHLVEPELVRAPTAVWEGAELPQTVSRNGAAKTPEHALRDPAVFRDGERLYLLWSVAGEQGIAIGEIIDD